MQPFHMVAQGGTRRIWSPSGTFVAANALEHAGSRSSECDSTWVVASAHGTSSPFFQM